MLPRNRLILFERRRLLHRPLGIALKGFAANVFDWRGRYSRMGEETN